MSPEQKELVLHAERILNLGPQGWVLDGFDLVHEPTGLQIWLANDWYGLKVKAGHSGGRITVGGVTSASSLFGYFIPWRRRIMPRAQLIRRELEAPTAKQQDTLERLRSYG